MSTTHTHVIKVTRNFYGPTKKASLLLGDEGRATRFASAAEARREIATLDASVYHQANNEFGRPEYQAVRIERLPAYLKTWL